MTLQHKAARVPGPIGVLPDTLSADTSGSRIPGQLGARIPNMLQF